MEFRPKAGLVMKIVNIKSQLSSPDSDFALDVLCLDFSDTLVAAVRHTLDRHASAYKAVGRRVCPEARRSVPFAPGVVEDACRSLKAVGTSADALVVVGTR